MVGAAIVWPLAVLASRGYSRARYGVGNNEFRSVWSAMIKVVVAAAFIEAFHIGPPRVGQIVIAGAAAVLASSGIRVVTRKVLHSRQVSGRALRKVVGVGHLTELMELDETLKQDPRSGLRLTGVCLPRAQAQDARDAGLDVLGDLDEVPEASRRSGCHAVAITNGMPTTFLRHVAWALEGEHVDLFVHPGLMEVAGPRMHIRPHVGLPLLQIEQPHFTGWRRVLKRAFDLTACTLGVLLISPVLLIVALLVKIGDGGPVLFAQRRIGLNGEPFDMYKFRSMVPNAESLLAQLAAQNEGAGPLFKMAKDPRITRVGGFLRRFSLDELPQLFNVIKGDMSLVGPRPPLEREVAAYCSATHRRLLVKPGVTGLWQVSGRSLLTWEESVRLDLRYVENWSLSLDMLILWKTAGAVLGKTGAY